MSPEQAMGEATDHRADVYALGIVMYEMFTGRVPFEADSYMGVLTKHMYMAPTPPSQLLATAELGVLEDITLRCLEKKPDHRYATLRELSHDLDLALNAPNGERPSASRQRRAVPRSLLADELELPAREERPQWSKRSARKRQMGWPLIIVGGLFLAGIAGMLAFRKAASVASGASGDITQLTTSLPAASVVRGVAAPLPIMSSSAVRALPATTEASPGAVSHSQASPRPKHVKASVGLGASRASGTPVATGASSITTRPARTDRSDIVDPWAK
jgi:serine/threonine protein kinase